MNLEESNDFAKEMEKNTKNKKTIISLIIMCVVILVVLFAIIGILRGKDALKLKMFVDGTEISIPSNLLIKDEDVNYMSVRDLSDILGYSYQNGEYKKYNEDANSCYLKNNYEIVSMVTDSNIVTKYLLNSNSESKDDDDQETNSEKETNQISSTFVVESANETVETFNIESKIKYINDELYIPFSEIPRIFNIQLDVSSANRIKIYTLDYLIKYGLNFANKLNYKEVSDSYENITAIIDNMLVVSDGTNYGVVSLENGKEIISLKYEKILYRQNTKEFTVTAEGSVGIVDSEGKTIIKPTAYDEISVLDELNKLYLVIKDSKYGVLDSEGKEIVYPEYDSIGIPEENQKEFDKEDIRNFNLLFDEFIPVELNGKYGLIDLEGNETLKCAYDSLGYLSDAILVSDSNKNSNTISNNTSKSEAYKSSNEFGNLLTISEKTGIKGIVVNYEGFYGIYDGNAKRLIIPCACTRIYSKTRNGNTKYYMEYNNEELELENYLEQNGLKNSDHNEIIEEDNENTENTENDESDENTEEVQE